MARWGLSLNFLGSIAVGLSAYKGLAAGFGGPIVWTSSFYRVAWIVGWVLNALGFLLQLLAIS